MTLWEFLGYMSLLVVFSALDLLYTTKFKKYKKRKK